MNATDTIRGARRPLRDDVFTCSRCGTHNRARTAEGCPWCADCTAVIAIDPEYLTQNNPPEVAQELADRWINRRRGSKRKLLVGAA